MDSTTEKQSPSTRNAFLPITCTPSFEQLDGSFMMDFSTVSLEKFGVTCSEFFLDKRNLVELGMGN